MKNEPVPFFSFETESPGGLVGLNDDDDNTNTVSDLDWGENPVSGEDDLKSISLGGNWSPVNARRHRHMEPELVSLLDDPGLGECGQIRSRDREWRVISVAIYLAALHRGS